MKTKSNYAPDGSVMLANGFPSQGGHKPGKHGKPGKLREFEKLSKSQGKLREIFYFCGKTWKTQGKCKICDIVVNGSV